MATLRDGLGNVRGVAVPVALGCTAVCSLACSTTRQPEVWTATPRELAPATHAHEPHVWVRFPAFLLEQMQLHEAESADTLGGIQQHIARAIHLHDGGAICTLAHHHAVTRRAAKDFERGSVARLHMTVLVASGREVCTGLCEVTLCAVPLLSTRRRLQSRTDILMRGTSSNGGSDFVKLPAKALAGAGTPPRLRSSRSVCMTGGWLR